VRVPSVAHPVRCTVDREERRPYNPHTLAGGYATKSLPDSKTAAVFTRYCAHADWLGTTTIGNDTVEAETLLAHGSVVTAIKILKALNRITKVPRYHPDKGRGRNSSVTRVHCTDEELRRAGATEENYFNKGGKASSLPIISSPKVKRVKDNLRSSKGQFTVGIKDNPQSSKRQLVGQEPLGLPFVHLPVETPCESSSIFPPSADSEKSFPAGHLPAKEGMKNRERQGTPSLPVIQKRSASSAPAPVNLLDDEPAEALRSNGCPDDVLFEIGKRSGWCAALNDTSNVISSYVTMATNGKNEKIRKLWMPGNAVTVAAGAGCDCVDPEMCGHSL